MTRTFWARGRVSRIRHVESENERVRATVSALRDDDRARLGKLFHEGGGFEVTIPELDRLALVDEGEAASFAHAMSAHGRTWLCRTSDGACELV